MSVKNIPRKLNDDELNKLTYFELHNLIRETKQVEEQIINENNLLMKYIQTWPPENNTPVKKTHPKISRVSKQKMGLEETEFSTSLSKFLEHESLLEIETKCEIAESGVENMLEKIQTLHQEWTNTIIPYTIKMDGLMLETKDLHIDISNFNRALSKGICISTGKLMLEKVLGYFHESTKRKEIKLQLCRQEHCELSTQEKQLEFVLNKRQEDNLGSEEIDYDHVETENALFIFRVVGTSESLHRIKLYVALITKLKQLTMEGKKMKNQFRKRRENIADLEIKIQVAENEEAEMNRHISYLKYRLDNFRLPNLMDYISTQAKIYELNKIIKVWQSRVNIASRSFDAKSKCWDRLKKKHNVCEVGFKESCRQVNTSDTDLSTSSTSRKSSSESN
uniref:CCDC113/CCDC96 coiled-coil domain-containing protein n=1 Tax=Strigamia maritima TaxID=126957 RepID=T1IPP9_STRMM